MRRKRNNIMLYLVYCMAVLVIIMGAMMVVAVGRLWFGG
jgi:hypothetical protein